MHYASLAIYVNSQILLESQSFDLQRSRSASPAYSIGSGYNGQIYGDGVMTLTVHNAVPARGCEFDAGRFLINASEIQINIFNNLRTLSFVGDLIEDSLSKSVDNPASYTFSVTGKFSNWTY